MHFQSILYNSALYLKIDTGVEKEHPSKHANCIAGKRPCAVQIQEWPQEENDKRIYKRQSWCCDRLMYPASHPKSAGKGSSTSCDTKLNKPLRKWVDEMNESTRDPKLESSHRHKGSGQHRATLSKMVQGPSLQILVSS